jgi:hypothetical protein
VGASWWSTLHRRPSPAVGSPAVARTARGLSALAHGEIRDGTDIDVIVDALLSPPTTDCCSRYRRSTTRRSTTCSRPYGGGCRRSDALPSTAHTAAPARSITASNDHRAPTKPQSTIQYRHRPRSPTELSVQQMSANRPGVDHASPLTVVCPTRPLGCPCRRPTHRSDDCRSLNSGSGHALLLCYLIRSGIYR